MDNRTTYGDRSTSQTRQDGVKNDGTPKDGTVEKNPHHLVMGELVDFITGHTLADTHDERYRQALARRLVEDLGFEKADIETNRVIKVQAKERTATLKIDLLVSRNDHVIMMIKYAPGSLVTRRLSNLALSRIIFGYQIPWVVTTNGEDAEVISGQTGRVVGQGLCAIPGAADPLINELPDMPQPVPPALADKASKIAFACWIDDACPCDGDICTLDD